MSGSEGMMRSADRSSTRVHQGGFSLIELLVSTVIFVMIVLSMSTLFHQSTVAWDGGTRKVRGNSNARGTLSFMSSELMKAVAKGDPGIGNPLNGWISQGAAASIEFVIFGDDANSTERIAKRITYEQIGDEIRRTERQCRYTGSPYGSYGPDKTAVLVDNVEFNTLTFTTPTRATDYTNDLPPWVKIRLVLSRSEDVSGVGVRSAGPKGVWGDANDISTW